MSTFDYFIALDGNGLNGFEGHAGVARLRCDPAANQFDIKVTFFPGLAGGHATQINKEGTVGYLGNLAQTLLFYDPRSMEEIGRYSTLRFHAPEILYSSQTHVVWTGEREFIAVLGADFYQFSLDALDEPVRLGAHGVTLPHALKRSPSGRYLFYGAMDRDDEGYAKQVGIFDLQSKTARIVELPATVWHLGVHPTKDVFYAPSQLCAPQGHMEFAEYTMGYYKNYIFEIDGESATVLRHASIAKELPAFLTSDVVVTEDEVLYNCCASAAIARIDLREFRHVRFHDERVSFGKSLKYWRTSLCNLGEAVSRVNIPGAWDRFAKSLRITRGSTLDGSYGLQLSPDRKYLLSAHRGKNQVIVYRYPDMKVVREIDFPSIREFFPEHVGRFGDPRLGFHHSALSVATTGM